MLPTLHVEMPYADEVSTCCTTLHETLEHGVLALHRLNGSHWTPTADRSVLMACRAHVLGYPGSEEFEGTAVSVSTVGVGWSLVLGQATALVRLC